MVGVKMGVFEVITLVEGALQIVPKKVELGIGDTTVQSNDCEGSVPPA